MKRTVALLLILGAALLEASPLEDLRIRFNDLASDIDERVQVLRAENSDAILEMNQKMLRLLGNYTVPARQAMEYKKLDVQVREWLNLDPEAQGCFDWALQLVDLYGWFIIWDIGWCATYAMEEISPDSQYRFFSHAHFIMRAGTEGRGRVLEAYGRYEDEEKRLAFVGEEYDWLSYIWTFYQVVLKDEIGSHANTADWIAEDLHMCLEAVLEDVDRWVQYIGDDLESCLEALESVEE